MTIESDGLATVARTLVALIGVCALAWFSLRWLSQRGFGGARSGARLKLIERLALGPRRQVYLVQADARMFLLGAGEAGELTLIAELDSQAPHEPRPPA
ncbi:MAG: flagellar biosynthetic protein FliO [Polyangiales bacterium]